MSKREKLVSWTTPFAIGAFTLSAVTGVMIFFKLNVGLVKPAHEWLSWLLVAGVALHCIAHWSSMARHLSGKVGRSIVIVFLVLILASLAPTGKAQGVPPGKLNNMLAGASFRTVAQVAGHDPGALAAELESRGMRVSDPERTVREIAMENKTKEAAVLDMIF